MLDNIKNWIKEKWKAFWKWILVIGTGTILIAQVSQPINTTFENLPNVAKEQGLYRVTFDQWSDVEIKDQNTPEVKLRKWGDETFIKLSYPDFSPVNPKQDKGKMKWVNGDKEVHLYQTKVGEVDAFEFEIILLEKPATNKIVIDIESQGLDFFYQPELTQEEIDEDDFRPENVIGSYAVYHKSKQGDYTALGGKNYKVGKAYHIYRPRINDAKGKWAWSEQEIIIDKNGIGQQIITMPQDFLDNAVYPIRHAGGDTFGHEGKGGTEANTNNFIVAALYTNDTAGSVDSLTAYVQQRSSDTPAMEWAVYDSTTHIGNTEEWTMTGGWDNWKTLNADGSFSVLAQNYYLAMWWGTDFLNYYYDATTWTSVYDAEVYDGNWPKPTSWTSWNNHKISVYCSYTPSAPPTRRIIMNYEQ